MAERASKGLAQGWQPLFVNLWVLTQAEGCDYFSFRKYQGSFITNIQSSSEGKKVSVRVLVRERFSSYATDQCYNPQQSRRKGIYISVGKAPFFGLLDAMLFARYGDNKSWGPESFPLLSSWSPGRSESAFQYSSALSSPAYLHSFPRSVKECHARLGVACAMVGGISLQLSGKTRRMEMEGGRRDHGIVFPVSRRF